MYTSLSCVRQELNLKETPGVQAIFKLKLIDSLRLLLEVLDTDARGHARLAYSLAFMFSLAIDHSKDTWLLLHHIEPPCNSIQVKCERRYSCQLKRVSTVRVCRASYGTLLLAIYLQRINCYIQFFYSIGRLAP